MDTENKKFSAVTSIDDKVDSCNHDFEQCDTDMDDEHIFRKNTCCQCNQVIEEIYVLQRRQRGK